MPLLMELIPVAIQLVGIMTFLYVSRSDYFQTLVAIVSSFIWLKVSNNKIPDEYGEMRLTRHLFGVIGDWLERVEALEEYDKAQSEFLMIEGRLEDDQYKSLITAAGVGNMVRSFAGILLTLYLVVVIVELW